MIKSRDELVNRKIEIDLNTPRGNAFHLLGLVSMLGKQLNIPKEIQTDIRNTMMAGNYDELLKTFDIWFGDYVILYK